jgi:iron complex outermembrane receptor protein
MVRIISTGLMAVLVLCSVKLLAEEALETVVVSAIRAKSTVESIPGSVTVITADDIILSGAEHVTDVLRGIGGIQVSDLYGDGTDASIGIRGFTETAQENTLIMIDGRRLNNADLGLPDLNSIDVKNIKQIEIIKGSAGTLYGDKAVGGVINIITQKPESFVINGSAEYGSYNRRSFYASVGNRHDNGINYRISALRRLNDNYRDNNRLRLTDISAAAGYEFDTGEVFVEYQNLNEDIRLPGALFADLVAADRKQTLNPGDHVDTDTEIYRVGIRKQILSPIELHAEYTRRDSSSNGQLSSGGFPSAFTQDRRHTELTPRLIGTFDIPTGQMLITLGADLFDTDYLIQSDFGLTDDEQQQVSVYAQGLIPLSDRLDLLIGARHGEVMNDILVDTLAFGRSLPEGTEIDDDANALEGGINFRFKDNWRLYAKIDRNFRFVTADEYSAVADNNFFANLFLFGVIVPLPHTQTGLSYEFGAEWEEQGRGFKVQFYQLDIDDEIVFDPTLFLNTNIGDTRRRGVMIEGHYALNDAIDFNLQYTYIDTEVTSGRFDGSSLTFVPDHSASLTARYRYNEQLSGFLEVHGISDRVFGGDFANSFGELPGYLVANLNLAYQMKDFRIALRVNNLLDKEYSDSGSIGNDFRQATFPQVVTYFPAPERNFLLSVSYAYH